MIFSKKAGGNLMNKFIPLSVPNFKGKELEYVTQAINTEWVSTAGAYIEQFEQKMAAYVGTKGAVACQSGTAGLHLALKACIVSDNDEVIVPTLTFIAAVNPVMYVNAIPVFVDCDDSLTIDPDKLENFCQENCTADDNMLRNKATGRTIKAILVVRVFGNMANMERICEIAQKYHLKVIEDATEALGTYYTEGKYKGRFAGTIGDIGVFSFNGNKIITTGGGGMLVSNNQQYLERTKHLSTQAKIDEIYFDHDEVGYNYRMTNLQAALGLAQLEQLEGFIEIKNRNYERYIQNELELLPFRKGIRSNMWFYSYKTKKRDELISYLNKNGIQTRPIWKLIHTLKPYNKAETYKMEKALKYYDAIVNLPCSTNLLEDDVDYICSVIKKFSPD